MAATTTFLAKVTLISSLVGAAIPVLQSNGSLDTISIVVSGLSGALIGLGCTVVEITFFSNRSYRWLRQVPMIAVVALRAMIYGLIIFTSLSTPVILLLGTQAWTDPDFLFNFWLSAGIATIISTSVELIQLLGREATASIFTGAYRRPRLENRIVMFADLIGSTALAERLGDIRFHELLGDVAYDLSAPIDKNGGEVHRYVGDAVIITWPMTDQRNFSRSVDCAKGMVQTLAEHSKDYLARYDQAMRMRIAIHCGPVAAGEVGAWKKEIALLGDTMNTVARIENAAREFDIAIVISEGVRNGLPSGLQHGLRRMTDYSARGKQSNIKLWSVKMQDPTEKVFESQA
ncbi:adenylate/guanylate cyclase domain-containing protein [Lutimaribacter marinistellae]|uniref:Adenylate/guanylate cyclase domain-containing protein n=1 Tax=Lutimaribacter marinistellae TaxID=1820329 RepID=A0ABV7TQP1_9RHOB